MQGKTFETCIWGISVFFTLLLFAGQNAHAANHETLLNSAQHPGLYAGALIAVYIGIKLLGTPRGQL